MKVLYLSQPKYILIQFIQYIEKKVKDKFNSLKSMGYIINKNFCIANVTKGLRDQSYKYIYVNNRVKFHSYT
jgi:hypothetical protein